MKYSLCLLLVTLGGTWAIPGITTDYAPDRVIVSYVPGTASAQSGDTNGLRYRSSLLGSDSIGVYSIVDGASVHDKIAELTKSEMVAWAEPDYIVTVSVASNDPMLKGQWHLAEVGMGSVWDDITATSEPICHVDSGIQTDHPDLKGVMLDSLNFVPTSDDYADYPIGQNTTETKDVEDVIGHGTHTAGIMAAVGNNGLGVSGMAWRAQLYVCRFIWADGTGFLSDAAACLDWCRSKGVKISNNSWGSFSISNTMQEAIKADRAAGSLFVAAAGNDNLNADNKEVYPAALVRMPTFDASHMIVVAAHDALDNIAGFSNYGNSSVHLAAPGVGVLSTVTGSGYERMDGTSMACPIVAATAALLRARARAFGLSMTMPQLRDIILTSVKILPDSPRLITKGKLDAKEALAVLYDLLREKKLMPGTPRRRLPPPSPPPPRYPPPPPPPTPGSIVPLECRFGDASCVCKAMGRSGIWADISGDCKYYYYCTSNSKLLKLCGPGQKFNTASKTCVSSEKVKSCVGISTILNATG